jgi:uncharacterized LabA/DUF88 family protein
VVIVDGGKSHEGYPVNPPGVWIKPHAGVFFAMSESDRAVIFIDGNNWFHALCAVGVQDRARLDYRKISQKLLGPRTWIGTRYYIGQLSQQHNPALYAQQRSFLSKLANTDSKISIHLGRIEPRSAVNEAAKELREYLAKLPAKIDPKVFGELSEIANRHHDTTVFVEKAVDVHLAIDLVTLAMNNEFDAAYVLSADGDYTPAVAAVRRLNKKVYAACPLPGAQLGRAVNSFIPLQSSWFDDCFL